MSATRPNTDGLRSDVCSALTMFTDTTTRSWLAKRPAVQRMPHCYLLGTADAALDIWFEICARKCAAQRQDAKARTSSGPRCVWRRQTELTRAKAELPSIQH